MKNQAEDKVGIIIIVSLSYVVIISVLSIYNDIL